MAKQRKKKTLINIDETFPIDPRLDVMTKLIGGDRELAVGSVVCFWFTGITYWKNGATFIPKKVGKHIRFIDQLVDAEFAEVKPEGYYVRGSNDFWSWYTEVIRGASKGGSSKSEAKKEAARRNGAKKRETNKNKDLGPKPPPSPTQLNPSQPKSSSSSSSSSSTSTLNQTSFKDIANAPSAVAVNPTSLLLNIRKECHRAVHRCEPIVGPQVMGILSQIIKQIGIEEAESAMKWFYRAPVQLYKTSGHDLKLMRRDLSKLVTECRSQSPIMPDPKIDLFNKAVKRNSQDEELNLLLEERKKRREEKNV